MLRFKKDDGSDYPDWEEKQLDEVCTIVGGGTPDTSIEEYWNGNIQWFTPTEIGHSKYVENSIKTITQVGLDKSSAKLLPKNTILLSTRATLGEMSIAKKECCTNQGFQALIVNKENNVDYIYGLKEFIKQYCSKYSSGSTFLEISKKQLSKCIIPVPSLEEQQQIANFLSNIDDVISASEQEIENLETQKKGAMQKIFNQEVRFKKDDGSDYSDWEEKTLGDIYSFQYGQFNNNPDNGANGIIGGYSDYNAERSVIIGHMGANAGSVLWEEKKHFVTYNGTITKPKNEYKTDAKYGYYMLLSKDISKICTGSGQPFLAYDTLNKIKLLYTSEIEEQKKIADFLSNFDTAI